MQHTIGIVQVNQILQGARHRGLDVNAILRRAAISPALLDSPLSRVTQAQYAALIRVLRRVTRDELWGLCDRPLPPGSFSQACRQAVHCPTIEDALRRGFSFYRLLLEDFEPRLVVVRGSASIRMLSTAEDSPRLGYAQRTFCFFTYGLISWLAARRIPLRQVMFRAIDVGAGNEAQRLFQAKIVHDSAWLGFEFEPRWLSAPVVQTLHGLEEFLQQAPARLLVRYRDRGSQAERVRRVLRSQLGRDLPSIESVSKLLATTPQTLRRRLRHEGEGFQELKDEIRRDAAIEFLSRHEWSLLEIATRLGFSEASTFHRAFKAWTGQAPGVYRRDSVSSRGSS